MFTKTSASHPTWLWLVSLLVFSGCDSPREAEDEVRSCDLDESPLGFFIAHSPIQGGYRRLAVHDSSGSPISQEAYPGIEWQIDSREQVSLVPSAFAYTPAFIPPTQGAVTVDVTVYDINDARVEVRCLRLGPGE